VCGPFDYLYGQKGKDFRTQLINAFNVYVTTRLVEGRADTYGALGIATALLFSLVLVGRLMALSSELNALLAERGNRPSRS